MKSTIEHRRALCSQYEPRAEFLITNRTTTSAGTYEPAASQGHHLDVGLSGCVVWHCKVCSVVGHRAMIVESRFLAV